MDGITLGLDDDGDDKAVDAEDTCHDDGDQGLEDHIGAVHAHLADTDTSLASTVSSTEVTEN